MHAPPTIRKYGFRKRVFFSIWGKDNNQQNLEGSPPMNKTLLQLAKKKTPSWVQIQTLRSLHHSRLLLDSAKTVYSLYIMTSAVHVQNCRPLTLADCANNTLWVSRIASLLRLRSGDWHGALCFGKRPHTSWKAWHFARLLAAQCRPPLTA